MRELRTLALIVVCFLIVTSPGCECQFSTANVNNARMARDSDGEDTTTVFAPTDVFYCVLTLANAPDDTNVKAVWTLVEAEGQTPNREIGKKEITGGGAAHFSLIGDDPWSPGKYKVDLYLNGKLDQTLEFEVQGS